MVEEQLQAGHIGLYHGDVCPEDLSCILYQPNLGASIMFPVKKKMKVATVQYPVNWIR